MTFPAPRRLPWLLLISAVILAADRLSKIWVTAHIPFAGAIPIIPGVLRMTHWTNEGAAFSLFADTASPHFVNHALITFNFLVAVGVLVALVRLGGHFNITTAALALVLGGALGNVHDRIAYGAVVDFIEVHIFTYHWPDFNIADSAIVTGACLLMLDSLRPHRAEPATSVREPNNAQRAELDAPPK
jgi:signal peptidase II